MNRRFHIDNMKCAGCVTTVRRALEALSGCEKAAVELESAMAEVTGAVDADQLMDTLKGLGYPATLMD